MGEPRAIKTGCLAGGNVDGYGGRDEIRRLLMSTNPAEFGGVADAYKTTSALLDDTIKALKDHAGRLVADGNWGGESARAMLTRMGQVQTYLRSLQGGINQVPPALQTVSSELAKARDSFDKNTEQHTYWVEASGMGAGSMEPANDPNADARDIMRQLNGHYLSAYNGLPNQLPWDEKLASPAPYLPAPADPHSAPTDGEIPFGDTVPRRSLTDLSGTSGYVAQSAAPLPRATAAAGAPATPVGGTPPPVVGPVPPGPPPAPGIPPVSGVPPVAGLPPSSVPAANPPQGPTRTQPPATLPARRDPDPIPPSTPVGRRDDPAKLTSEDPLTGLPQDQPRTQLRQTGPSMRPGTVPVVDGTWPAGTPTVSAGGPGQGTNGAGGMPFLPMGGGGGADRQSTRRALSGPGDDDFFGPVGEHAPPVVG